MLSYFTPKNLRILNFVSNLSSEFSSVSSFITPCAELVSADITFSFVIPDCTIKKALIPTPSLSDRCVLRGSTFFSATEKNADEIKI